MHIRSTHAAMGNLDIDVLFFPDLWCEFAPFHLTFDAVRVEGKPALEFITSRHSEHDVRTIPQSRFLLPDNFDVTCETEPGERKTYTFLPKNRASHCNWKGNLFAATSCLNTDKRDKALIYAASQRNIA